MVAAKRSYELMPWSEISKMAGTLLKPAQRQWKQLILKKKAPESAYHRFLVEYGRLFFADLGGVIEVVSKLRFGADFVSDFVAIRDVGSYGLTYEIVEIEIPQAHPFTGEGIASARLSRAIQQVLNWRMWLQAHVNEARRIFPSGLYFPGARPVFTFKIIIGTRENSSQWLDRRNALSEALGISIRSFDSLTEQLNRSFFFNSILGGAEEDSLPIRTKNALANPFMRALSDSDWRKLVNGRLEHRHFLAHNHTKLLELRKPNHLLRKFKSLIERKHSGLR